ncbi:hypothetical protein NG726_24710 [Pseudomonas sp. MOB-449]|nr:hypothetical protein [Pseudomonas sp. MOB-449]
MQRPTQQHMAGLKMAKDIVTTEGMCASDIPATLDVLIDEAILSPEGRTTLEELFDLIRELRKCGARTAEKLQKTDFDRGMGLALTLVMKRIRAMR